MANGGAPYWDATHAWAEAYVPEPEVRAFGHRVDRHGGDAARAQHRAVVADPAQDTVIRPACEDALDRLYQAQLTQRSQRPRYRCR